MDQKVYRLVKRSLSHLCEEHREQALDLLIVLGLKHYQLLYTDQSVHLPILEYLCGKYVDDLAKAPAGKRTASSNKDIQHSTSTSLGNRQYRQDSMAHYPFADNSGTVTDVLHVESSDLRKLLDMGEPACKRLVIRIFEEMRFSKVGLKMSDVPEALSRLGLTVSPALRKILERTDPDTFSRKISATKNHRHSSYTESDFAASYLTLAQFMRVVKRLIYLHRSGKNPDDFVHLFGSSEQGLGRDVDGGFGSDVDNDNGTSADGQSDGEWEREAKSAHQEEDQVDHTLEQARNTRMSQRRHHQNTTNTTSNTTSNTTARKAGTEQEQFLRGLKHVPSKISSVVNFDRRRHQQTTQRTNKAALRTVAQRRVDALVSTAVPVGFRDRNYFTEPQLFHSKPSVRSGEFADRVLSRTTPTTTTSSSNQHYKRYADLGTGLATMEIADAFLQGEIGREILSTTESDYRSFPDEELLNPASAQRTAAVLLGLPTHSTHTHSDGARRSETFPSRMYPSSPSNGDARFAPNAGYHNTTNIGGNSTYPQSVHTSNSVNARDHGHNYTHHSGTFNPNSGTGGVSTNSITGAALGGNSAGAMHVSNYATSQADYRLNQYGQQAANTNLATNPNTNRNTYPNPSSNRNPNTNPNPNSNPTYTTSTSDFGHRSLQDKRSTQQLNDVAKRLYEAPGWRSAQGGWVADFGPPHTHALYTGPEVNYTTIAHDAAVNRRAQADRAASQGPLIPASAADDDDYQYDSSVRRDTATVTSTYKQRPDHLGATSATTSGATNDAERHVQRALHSASWQTSLLEAQYRANEEEIDSMIRRTNREVAGFGGGGLSTSFSSSAVAFDAATGGTGGGSGDGASGVGAARRSYEQQSENKTDHNTHLQHHLQHQQHQEQQVQVVKKTNITTTTVRSSYWDDRLGDDDEEGEEGILSVDTAVAGAGAGALRDLAHKTYTTHTSTSNATSANANANANANASSSRAQGLGAGIAAPVSTTAGVEEGSDSSDGFDYAHNPYTFGEGFGESSDDSAVNLNDSMSLSAAARNI